MSLWIPSLLAAAASRAARAKPLDLLNAAHRPSLLSHSTTAANAADADDTPGAAALLARFSDIAPLFTRRRARAPPPGARPHRPNAHSYNRLMKAFGRAGRTDEVFRLFCEMKQRIPGCAPDARCYTTVIDALVSAGRPWDAEAVFEEMLMSGVRPDAAAYTVLVKLYSFCLKRFDTAFEVVRWMVRSGCIPDVVTYSTLIAGLCRAGRVEEAWNVLDRMLRRSCAPNAHTYTPILQSYCSDGRIRVAMRLLESMRRVGCAPDAVAYNILIQGLCKMGKFDEVENVLGRSESEGWKPDAVSYNTYISGLCKMGKADEAFKLLEVMLGRGLHPTTVTLNILLDCLCRDFKVWEVKCLLERSFELELDVDVDSYNTVMSRLHEIGEWPAVLKLFSDMFKKGIVPDIQTFNIVINSLCKANKLHEARCIFTSKGFEADTISYNILFHAFYAADRFCEIHSLFCNMDVKKVSPDTVTYNTMIDCLCKDHKFFEAINFVKSLGDGISSDLLAHLTFGLVWGGKLGEMLRLFEELLVKGLVLDARIYNSLITAFCRRGSCQSVEIHKVCLILDRMLNGKC